MVNKVIQCSQTQTQRTKGNKKYNNNTEKDIENIDLGLQT